MDVIQTDIVGSKSWLISFYREQLRHFDKVGLGNYTQHDVRVTEKLIAITEKRLKDLTTIYDNSISRSYRLRKRRAERKVFNGQHTNHNGTTTPSRVQHTGDTRHGGDKS